MMLPLAKADCLIIREAYDPPAKAGAAAASLNSSVKRRFEATSAFFTSN